MGINEVGINREGELVRSLLIWLEVSVAGETRSFKCLGGIFFLFSVFTIAISVLVSTGY